MDEKIALTFTEGDKYRLEFTPPQFWIPFAKTYSALPWEEISEERAAIVAENYSYLLDLLVHARLYYLGTRRIR
jgi:hypothetical protein